VAARTDHRVSPAGSTDSAIILDCFYRPRAPAGGFILSNLAPRRHIAIAWNRLYTSAAKIDRQRCQGRTGPKVLGPLAATFETERPLELADPASILLLARCVLGLRGTLWRAEGV